MAASDYSARHLSVLEGLEAVRKRPGMYIGSTDSRGLMHCLWEIIDNSVDEALGGHGDRIDVRLHPDGSVEVRDTARGVPVDIEPKTGLSGVEVVFTKLHAGGKFGSGSYASSGGLHGVGASVVNALSERLDVEVDRGGKTHAMSFRRGEPGIFEDEGEASPDAPFRPFTSGSELRVVGKVRKGVTGTRIRYWADRQIFTRGASFLTEELLGRARQTAFLVPGLSIDIEDLRGEQPVRESFRFDGGIAEFVDHLAVDAPLTDTWRLQGSGTFTETVPVLTAGGAMVPTELTRECAVDIALRWGTGYDTRFKSFVNIIATPKGGTHQAGFEAGLLKFVRAQVEANARKLKVGTDKLEKDDVLAGLTAVLTVRFPEPQFEGQTKEVLGTPAVRAIVSQVVQKAMAERFASTRREDKAQTAVLLEKVVGEMKSRISARTHKETQRRKNALESSSLPAKLVDCRSNDVANSELFIVEGDSALGTAKLARDSEYQALLPIRGKILNVQKASLPDMLSNTECASIIQVLGAGSGRTFDLSAARYGKIIIMSDADVDGAHIRTLLLTLFFRYMRPMIDEGRVFAAVPPLHRVVVMNPGSKPNDVIYTYSERELAAVLAQAKRQGKRYQDPIQRYKGLGEMDADQLATTTMDRRNRTLRRVRVDDAEAATRMFELLMGNDVAPRKEFIIDGAGSVRDRIDV
ncbi:DNA topoisomerase IV subunit B [Clavibacter michiganensis]|uniref:DNA gyrase/topoisomerase IV subunit B n=4 Tax=Clavibacter michiganensis TaxID=28447 RepID=UPI0026DB68D0|nr:DNA topoisomerase IV subunit B [Clavibacter michiganensis]MDO4036907.1 DNA topoisomerase IV subunit B [Clavibacter michiganensis]MDO4049351.1 DNA topoisomerase IV subunit B [Clavibacter michiganensis]MDO4061500.1 DNA topoisomerase IV subunit B [Clavibacter michiganensis]MDO4084354.1 DNA topoisomerase IV subunit B [Clavibacter michiganensis]MDO4111035.1 DNA topoisomerase IV subunit B [Clavibacter michiganensis]